MLTSGHLTVDMYAGILPVAYPILSGKFDLDLKTVGLVALSYSGAASISQPFFGWLADRYGTRLTGIALAWTGVTFALIGLAPSFELLIVAAVFAGLGSGAFHPFGAVTANALTARAAKNSSMSVYTTGGTIGVAIGPLVGAVIFALFGLPGLLITVVPGLAIGGWLLRQMARGRIAPTLSRDRSVPVASGPIPFGPLAAIVGVMMLRMFPIIGVQSFVPLWYEQMGYSPAYYSALATTIVLASAVGAIGAGNFADRFGRRAVVMLTLVLSLPAFWVFQEFPGPLAFVSGAVVGFLGASTTPLMLVMSQQLLHRRAGLASGMILGLGFIAGAIGAPVIGALADRWGMQDAIRSLLLVIALTLVVAWLLPSERRMDELTVEVMPRPRPA